MSRIINNYCIIFCGILLSFSIQSASAASFKDSQDKRSVYISLGQKNVKANELVYGQPSGGYPADYKLSQLIWETQNIPMLFTGVKVRLSPFYTLNVDGQFAIARTKGVMDDYDWEYVGSDWSGYSHHEDTTLTESAGININLDFNILGKKRNQLSVLVGYKKEIWAWESRGGNYIYSTNSTTGFRTSKGSFVPGQLVISYQQNLSMPYIGLRFASQVNNWKFNFQYDYSDRVSITATDDHYLRNLIFEDEFADSTMNAYKFGVAYQISPKFDLVFAYDVQNYEEARGNTIYVNDDTGALRGGCTNCAGADNSSATWSFGTRYAY